MSEGLDRQANLRRLQEAVRRALVDEPTAFHGADGETTLDRLLRERVDAQIRWETLSIEQGERPGTILLTVEVHGAHPTWARRFNRRARQHAHVDAAGMWGSILFVDDCLIVTALQLEHLPDLREYLARIWR